MKTKLIIIITVISVINFITLPSIFAAEPTSTASSSSDFQAKLKALQEEIASKAAKLKVEVSKKLQNKAYVGFLKSRSDTSLTLATDTGTKIITINEYSEFLGGTKLKKFNLNTLEADQYLAALGDVDETEVLTAKRIIKLEPPEEIKRKIIFGSITTLGEQTFTMKTLDKQKFNFSTSSKTIYQQSKDSADFTDIKLTSSVIVVGVESSSGALKARFIYILPSSSNKISTPSATPKAKKI